MSYGDVAVSVKAGCSRNGVGNVAKAFADVLKTAYGFDDVVLLLNGAATKDAVLDAVKRVVSEKDAYPVSEDISVADLESFAGISI